MAMILFSGNLLLDKYLHELCHVSSKMYIQTSVFWFLYIALMATGNHYCNTFGIVE